MCERERDTKKPVATADLSPLTTSCFRPAEEAQVKRRRHTHTIERESLPPSSPPIPTHPKAKLAPCPEKTFTHNLVRSFVPSTVSLG